MRISGLFSLTTSALYAWRKCVESCCIRVSFVAAAHFCALAWASLYQMPYSH